MTRFNEVSERERQPDGNAWTPSKSDADPLPESLETDTDQAYVTNYGADSLPAPSQSPETTFAPMPNPSDFAAGTTAPLPSEATTSIHEQKSLVGNPVAATPLASPRSTPWTG